MRTIVALTSALFLLAVTACSSGPAQEALSSGETGTVRQAVDAVIYPTAMDVESNGKRWQGTTNTPSPALCLGSASACKVSTTFSTDHSFDRTRVINIRFDLGAALTCASVTSATLTFHQGSCAKCGSAATTASLYRATAGTANWAQSPVGGTCGYDTAAAPGSVFTGFATSPLTATIQPPGTDPASLAFSFDVKSDVLAWLGGATNYGWQLRAPGLTPPSAAETCPSGHLANLRALYSAAASSDLRPSLAVTYTVPNCDDNNPCTTDSCGPGGTCTHSPVSAGTVCHGSTGTCDPAETCNGTVCPPDVKSSAGTSCGAASSGCDTGGTCNGTSAACQPGTAKPAGTICRAAALGQLCDLAETCDGSSTVCPPDVGVSVGTCTTTDSQTGTCSAGTCVPTAISPNLVAWGFNAHGELGTGTTGSFIGTPTTIGAPKGIVSVAGGMLFTVALDSTGAVWTWGSNGKGQLGDAAFTGTVRAAPTMLNFFGNLATSVAAGSQHGLVLTSYGAVYAFGDNQLGELGTGSLGGSTLGADPSQVVNLSNVIAVAAGDTHSIALTASGEVWCWGAGTSGQLGNGGSSSSGTPVKASMPVRAIAIAAGSSFTMALGVDGNVYAWGPPTLDELGTPGTTNVLVPTRVSGIASIRAIAAGGTHGFALHADGTVYAWGRNFDGELGRGFVSENGSGPARVQMAPNTPLTNVISISSGARHGAAVRDDGTVWTWGSNESGELGDPSRVTIPDDNTSPGNRAAKVPNLTNVRTISSKGYQLFAVQAFRHVYDWGNNNLGRLGNPSNTSAFSSVPVPVTGLPATKAISASCSHALALAADGNVWGWGDNVWGQLGSAVTQTSTATPTALGLSNVVAIAAGCVTSVALKSDGSVWVWGYGQYGAIGNGSTNSTPIPTKVNLFYQTAISAKGGSVLSLDVNGGIHAWGENGHLQAGRTPNTNVLTPNPIGEPPTRAIAAGLYSNYALHADGTVAGWGKASDCELGYGGCGPADQWAGVLVHSSDGSGNLQNVTNLGAGYRFVYAVSAGIPSMWGWNLDGELGLPTPTKASLPIALVTYPVFPEMAAGWYTILIRASTGGVYAAGSGQNGGLGNGVTSPSNGWVPVSNIQGASSIAGGKDFGMALTP
jgi:alpha-tubulin suppressor-like RCC1 family protein